jgi:hypothetical protein
MRKLIWVALVLSSSSACTEDDSTDISGNYAGNATYTISPTTGVGLVGAGSAGVLIENDGDDQLVTLDSSGCVIAAAQIEELSVYDKSGDGHYIFTSDALVDGQTCTLPIGVGGQVSIAIASGDLVADHGLTLTLQLGGTVSAASDPSEVGGYAVWDFAGAHI